LSSGPFCAKPPSTVKPVLVWLTVLLVPPPPQALNTTMLSADNARRIIFFMADKPSKKTGARPNEDARQPKNTV